MMASAVRGGSVETETCRAKAHEDARNRLKNGRAARMLRLNTRMREILFRSTLGVEIQVLPGCKRRWSLDMWPPLRLWQTLNARPAPGAPLSWVNRTTPASKRSFRNGCRSACGRKPHVRLRRQTYDR